jgi:serine/threonine protein kinase
VSVDLVKCPRCGSESAKGELAGLCPKCTFGEVVGALDAASGELPIGTELGDYTILARVARGGMGVVYRARQKSLGRDVALKVLALSDHPPAEALARFSREAALTGRLDHPGIVPVHEFGNRDGVVYLTMPFIDGETLTEIIRRTITPRDAVQIVRRLAAAVHYAHERRILHRDLKPANVLIDAAGEPRITDFGLAKELSPDQGLTLSGIAMGTPPYAAPELVSGRLDEVDRRTDVYALGAILYECLTGRTPFNGATATETIDRVLHQEPEAPRRLVPTVPADIEAICLKCLEKDRTRRYATAADLGSDLDRVLQNEPVVARPVTTFTRITRRVQRNKSQAVAVVSTSTLVVVLALLLLRSTPPPERQDNSAAFADRTRDFAQRLRNTFAQSPVDDVKRSQLKSELGGLMFDLVDRYGGTTEAYYHLGLANVYVGERLRAISLYSQALRLQPGHLPAREARLKLWIRDYREARSLEASAPIWSLIHAEFAKAPDVQPYAEAARRWRRNEPVAWNPDLTDAGECMLAALAGDGARLSRVIELEPDNAEALFLRAKQRWDVDRKGSTEDLDRVEKLAPALAAEVQIWRRDHR